MDRGWDSENDHRSNEERRGVKIKHGKFCKSVRGMTGSGRDVTTCKYYANHGIRGNPATKKKVEHNIPVQTDQSTN